MFVNNSKHHKTRHPRRRKSPPVHHKTRQAAFEICSTMASYVVNIDSVAINAARVHHNNGALALLVPRAPAKAIRLAEATFGAVLEDSFGDQPQFATDHITETWAYAANLMLIGWSPGDKIPKPGPTSLDVEPADSATPTLTAESRVLSPNMHGNPVREVRMCRQCFVESATDDGFCSDACMNEYNAQTDNAVEKTRDEPQPEPEENTPMLPEESTDRQDLPPMPDVEDDDDADDDDDTPEAGDDDAPAPPPGGEAENDDDGDDGDEDES